MLHIENSYYKQLAGLFNNSIQDEVYDLDDEITADVYVTGQMEVVGVVHPDWSFGPYGVYDVRDESWYEPKKFDLIDLHFRSAWDGSEVETDFDKSKIKQYL